MVGVGFDFFFSRETEANGIRDHTSDVGPPYQWRFGLSVVFVLVCFNVKGRRKNGNVIVEKSRKRLLV